MVLLTADRYRDEVFDPTVRPYAAAIGSAFVLMDDNVHLIKLLPPNTYN